jgi:hypothetical protein
MYESEHSASTTGMQRRVRVQIHHFSQAYPKSFLSAVVKLVVAKLHVLPFVADLV